MTIYLADDERSAAAYLERSVRAILPEAEITAFTRASALLEAFRAKPADIVFLDIEMPGMTGIELARALTGLQERLNLIFVTGYSDYAMDALDLFASGYLLKPCTPEKVQRVLDRLRYPIRRKKDIFIRTFGNFDVFCRGTPVSFRWTKSKELLAYLVDRDGAVVSRQEAAGILYGDDYSRSTQANLSHTAARLSEDLAAAGITGLFLSGNGFRVDLSLADCDLSELLKGSSTYPFPGEYMEQYSWGEQRKGLLLRGTS